MPPSKRQRPVRSSTAWKTSSGSAYHEQRLRDCDDRHALPSRNVEARNAEVVQVVALTRGVEGREGSGGEGRGWAAVKRARVSSV